MSISNIFNANNHGLWAQKLNLLSTTAATSNVTGSLVVHGGVGIVGDVWTTGFHPYNADTIQFNRNIKMISTAESTDTQTGSLITAGGVGIGGNLNVDGLISGTSMTSTGVLHIIDTTQATDTQTGSLITDGGVSVAGNVYIGGTLNAPTINATTIIYEYTENITSTNDSTSISTGSSIVAGGEGIAKSLNVGGILKVWATIDATDTQTGAIQSLGGAGISKSLFVGSGINSENAILYGKKLLGGKWWKIYNVGILQDDTLMMKKNNTNDVMCLQSYEVGGSISTGTITTNCGLELGSRANASRICSVIPWVEYTEIDNDTYINQANIGEDYMQVFKAVTGKKLTAISAHLSDTGSSSYTVAICTGATYNPANIIAVSNAETVYTWGIYKFNFDIAVPMSAGQYYCAVFKQTGSGQRWYRYNIAYSDGNMFTLGNVDIGCDLDFVVYTATEVIESDIFIYGTSDVNSIVRVEIDHCGGTPLWTDEGTGTWPNSITGISKIISYDTNDTTNYPSNITKDIGSMITRNTTQATDTQTGSLITSGGLGVAKDAYIGGTLNANTLNMTSTIESTDTTTGSFIVDGGLGVVKNTNVGGILKTWNTTQSTDSQTGSLITSGGLGVTKDVYIGGTLNVPTQNMTSTIQSTDTQTGALITAGGLAVAKNLNIGGLVKVYDVTQSTDTLTGSIQLLGGLAVGKNISVASFANLKDINISGIQAWPSYKLTHNQAGSTDFATMTGLTAGATTMYFSIKPLTQTIANKCVISADSTGKMVLHSEGSAPIIELDSTVQATDTNTGALRILGGVGIAKNIYVGGIVKNLDTTQSTDTLTGSLITAGGVGIAKNIYVGGIVKNLDTTQSTDTLTGSLITAGGVGIAKSLNVGGISMIKDTLTINTLTNPQLYLQNPAFGEVFSIYIGTGGAITFNNSAISDATLNFAKNLKIAIDNTVDSSNISTGSLIDSGGVGIAKNLNIGGITKVWNTTNSTDTLTGALEVVGGAGVGGNLYVGGTIYGSLNGNSMQSASVTATSTTESTNEMTGALIISGGFGCAKNVNIGGFCKVTITTESTSTSTGALISYGGCGIAKRLNVGGSTNIIDTSATTSTSTGCLSIAGGIGIAKGFYLAGRTIYGSLSVDITGSGPLNDIVLPSSSIVYLTGTLTNNVHITGFSSTGVIDGQQVRLIGYYASNTTVVIDHDSASSAAANRIYTNTGANVNMVLNPISATLYIYNAGLSRWLMICVDP
jgi:hypothetical protein